MSLPYMEIISIVGFCRHFEDKQELQYSTFSRRSIQKGVYVLVADHPFLHLLMLQFPVIICKIKSSGKHKCFTFNDEAS